MSFQTKLTAIEHAAAAVGALTIGFLTSTYGQTLLKGYPSVAPIAEPLTLVAMFLAAFYHSPKQNGQ